MRRAIGDGIADFPVATAGNQAFVAIAVGAAGLPAFFVVAARFDAFMLRTVAGGAGSLVLAIGCPAQLRIVDLLIFARRRLFCCFGRSVKRSFRKFQRIAGFKVFQDIAEFRGRAFADKPVHNAVVCLERPGGKIVVLILAHYLKRIYAIERHLFGPSYDPMTLR